MTRPGAPAAADSDRYLLPAPQTSCRSNKQTDRQTDRQTDTVPLHRSVRLEAASVNDDGLRGNTSDAGVTMCCVLQFFKLVHAVKRAVFDHRDAIVAQIATIINTHTHTRNNKCPR